MRQELRVRICGRPEKATTLVTLTGLFKKYVAACLEPTVE